MKEDTVVDREDALKRENALKKEVLSKYQINFEKLNEATELSPTKKYFTWIQNALVGTVGGMGAGSTLMFIVGWSAIAIAGITIATVFTTLATVSGGALIGIFSLLYARQQTIKDEQALKKSKADVDEKQKSLQSNIIDFTKSFQQLNDLLQEKYNSAVKNGLLEKNDDQFKEYVNGNHKLADKHSPAELVDLQEIIDARRKMMRHLLANLSLITGDSYQDKLAHVFNANKNNLLQVMGEKATAEQKPFVERGLPALMTEIDRISHFDKPSSDRGIVDDRMEFRDLKAKLDDSLVKSYTAYKGEKHHKVIRKLTTSYGIAAVGGFFTGIGGYIAIASLVAGGAATLLTGGAALPILLGGLAVATACAGLAVLYRRHVERKKQAANKMIDRTKETLNISSSNIEERNGEANEILNKFSKKAKTVVKSETRQQEFSRKVNQSKIEGYIVAKTDDEEPEWQRLAKEFQDIHAGIDSSVLLLKGNVQDKETHFNRNITFIQRFTHLKLELESMKNSFHKKAASLQINPDELKEFEGYKKLDAKLERIVKDIAELELHNQHYLKTSEKKSLLVKGEEVKQAEYREKTVNQGNGEQPNNQPGSKRDKSHH